MTRIVSVSFSFASSGKGVFCVIAGLALAFTGQVAAAQWSEATVEWRSPPDNWELIAALTTYRDVVWTGERYLAVGSTAARTSPDGRGLWALIDGSSSSHTAVASGPGGTVAVGWGGTIQFTSDALAWQTIETGTSAAFHGVAHGNGRWVAVGTAVVFTSPNGVDWTNRSTPETPEVTGAAFGNGSFVTVGIDAVHTSADGENWQAHPVSAFGGAAPHALAFLKDRFFAATATRVLTSFDGLEWTQVMETVPEESVRAFGTAADRFLALGFRKLYASLDGETWRGEFFPTVSGPGPRGLAAGEDHLVMVGGFGILRSDLHNPMRAGGLAYGNGRFVAVGSNGRLLVSQDGISWNESAAPALEYLWDIVHADDRFVAVGSHGAIVTSADGETWTAANSQTGRSLTGVTFGNGRFVAVGGDGVIRFSDDAVEWLPSTGPGAAIPLSLRGVAFGEGVFVAVGHDGTILRSMDGESWSPFSQDRVDRINGVAYGNGRFVAVGMKGLVLVSETGERWLKYPLDISTHLARVRFLDGTFVAAGWTGEIFYSKDGEKWTVEQTPATHVISDIAAGSGEMVVMGLDGGIFSSPSFPGIYQQPADQTVAVGDVFSLAVSTGTNPTPALQWYKNGQAIPGATGASFNPGRGARLADEGLYQVSVDNGVRMVWSMPARLTVVGDYFDWLAESSYTPDELEQSEYSAPAADPDGYRVPNILRYAFGLDPHTPDLSRLPRLGWEPVRDYGQTGTMMVFDLPRLREDELDFGVERSWNLTDWTPFSLSSFDVVLKGNRQLLILDSSVLPPSSPAAFFRLRVDGVELPD